MVAAATFGVPRDGQKLDFAWVNCQLSSLHQASASVAEQLLRMYNLACETRRVHNVETLGARIYSCASDNHHKVVLVALEVELSVGAVSVPAGSLCLPCRIEAASRLLYALAKGVVLMARWS